MDHNFDDFMIGWPVGADVADQYYSVFRHFHSRICRVGLLADARVVSICAQHALCEPSPHCFSAAILYFQLSLY